MTVPIISIVGNSGAGKTAFLEKLIRELKSRGYRVAAIKHDAHNFQMDHPGKDTYRLAEAGSDIVIISAPDRLALLESVREERTLDELVAMVSDRVDIVLTEGYRRAAKAKIEVSRRDFGNELVASSQDLLALVTDQQFDLDIPHFGLNDAAAVADLLERRFGLTPTGRAAAVRG
ncbi:MAG: molybdopterin-guanine dinucleotide biosynthesis protein B [Chloroflexi bacterium]|nr:molybdopterin-guanine dinucleotide biosynthesis protein B [Chloroflexota bacterium]